MYQRRRRSLAAQEFDHLVDVHRDSDVLVAGIAYDLGHHLSRFYGDEGAFRSIVSFETLGIDLLEVFPRAHLDGVAGFADVAGDVGLAAVDHEVAVGYRLAALRPGGGETGSADYVVESALAKQQEVLTLVAALLLGDLEEPLKLGLAESVVVTNFLLLYQSPRIIGGPSPPGRLLTGGVRTTVGGAQGARGIIDIQSQPSVDSGLWTCVMSHIEEASLVV